MTDHSMGSQRTEKHRDWTWLAVAGLILAALITRTAAAQLERVIKWDESDYLMLGRNLWAGRGFTTAGYPEVHYPPLVPLLFGLAQEVASGPEEASELPYILAGAFLLLPYFALARRMYGTRLAILAGALLVGFAPLTIHVLYWGTMTEPLYLLLIYTGLYFLWRALNTNRLVFYGAAGLMFALAYLARPEGILYFGLFLAFAVIWHGLRGTLRRRESGLGLASYVAIFALCSLPYVIYLRAETGRWTFSGKVGVTFDLGAAVIEQDPAAYDAATASLDSTGNHIIWFSPERFQKAEMGGQVLGNPSAFVKRILANLALWEGVFFRKSVFPYVTLGIVVLALFRQPWSRARAEQEIFLAAALMPAFGFLALHIELRFFAPLFPILLLWTAKGCEDLGSWLRDTLANLWVGPLRPWIGHTLGLLPFALLLAFFVAIWPVAVRTNQAANDLGAKEAGLWLRSHAPVDANIMSRDVAIAVYAERRWVPSPHAALAAFLDYARFHDVDYIVVSQRETTVLRPQLGLLMDESGVPPELVPVHQAISAQGATVIFRLEGES